MNKMFVAVQDALKAFTLRWNASRWSSGWTALSLGATDYNYRRVVGSGQGNSAVQAVVKWVCRTFPEAPLELRQRQRDGTLDVVQDHALVALLERPNPHYSGLDLWAGLLSDLLLTGNAYWVKVRSGAGRIVELWWVPACQMEPRWPQDGRPPFVSHYEYQVDGDIYNIPPEDVLHFRDGFDPANIRKGLSPLMSLLREIATDDEASNFTASMLRNMGVPGVVLSPTESTSATDADLEEVKVKFAQTFGGDNRGKPLVLRGPTNVAVLSFNPEQMQLRDIRRIPEERISAIYGVAAVVVGLGAGLDRSTFSNMAEAREAAYESMLIPLQRQVLATLQHGLVPDFGDPRLLRLGFDYSAVRVLQDDQNALMLRAVQGFQGGVLTRAEARQLVGEEAAPVDKVFALPSAYTVLPRDHTTEEPVVPAPLALAAGDTTGDPSAEPAAGPQAAGLTDAELKGDAPFVGIFSPEALTAAAAFAQDLGLGELLDAAPATNGRAH